jgi:hypothetical protein
MTGAEAREILTRGGQIRIVVGVEFDDPTCILSLRDGMVLSESVAGWSAGVVEPVCEIESDFLDEFLQDRHSVEPLIGDPRPCAGTGHCEYPDCGCFDSAR